MRRLGNWDMGTNMEYAKLSLQHVLYPLRHERLPAFYQDLPLTQANKAWHWEKTEGSTRNDDSILNPLTLRE
jgi:hypothetical protein